MATAARPVLTLALSRILFATDFSACSEGALPYARKLAEQFGAKLDMVHVLPPGPLAGTSAEEVLTADAEVERARQQMARLLMLQRQERLTRETLIQRGPLWHVLAGVIEDEHIDLIVIGTQGQEGRKKLALGSAAEEIFHRSSCPVMTIGPHICPDEMEEGQITSVLYATDFSDASLQALPYALELARENCARITLLHVLPCRRGLAVQMRPNAGACSQQLLSLVPRSIQQVCPTDAVVLFGSVTENILRLAGEQQEGLIVMGLKKQHIAEAAGHLPWAIAHCVVCEAPCPVLTVRG